MCSHASMPSGDETGASRSTASAGRGGAQNGRQHALPVVGMRCGRAERPGRRSSSCGGPAEQSASRPAHERETMVRASASHTTTSRSSSRLDPAASRAGAGHRVIHVRGPPLVGRAPLPERPSAAVGTRVAARRRTRPAHRADQVRVADGSVAFAHGIDPIPGRLELLPPLPAGTSASAIDRWDLALGRHAADQPAGRRDRLGRRRSPGRRHGSGSSRRSGAGPSHPSCRPPPRTGPRAGRSPASGCARAACRARAGSGGRVQREAGAAVLRDDAGVGLEEPGAEPVVQALDQRDGAAFDVGRHEGDRVARAVWARRGGSRDARRAPRRPGRRGGPRPAASRGARACGRGRRGGGRGPAPRRAARRPARRRRARAGRGRAQTLERRAAPRAARTPGSSADAPARRGRGSAPAAASRGRRVCPAMSATIDRHAERGAVPRRTGAPTSPPYQRGRPVVGERLQGGTQRRLPHQVVLAATARPSRKKIVGQAGVGRESRSGSSVERRRRARTARCTPPCA